MRSEYPKDYEKKYVEIYAKQDLKDNDWTWSDFKILTVKQCKSIVIDPFDDDNWYKIKANKKRFFMIKLNFHILHNIIYLHHENIEKYQTIWIPKRHCKFSFR